MISPEEEIRSRSLSLDRTGFVRVPGHSQADLVHIDIVHAEHQRARLDLLALLDFERHPRPGRHVPVSSGVDHDPAQDGLAAGFVFNDDAPDRVFIHSRCRHVGVEQ